MKEIYEKLSIEVVDIITTDIICTSSKMYIDENGTPDNVGFDIFD